MPKLEKFGSFVLLEEIGADYLGRIYRAAKLGMTGFEKLVYLTKINPNLAQDSALMKTLIEELKACAQINNPNIARVYGCGKIEGAYFISWEFVEGKDLGVVFTRMGDGFPLALDQSLHILSRVIAAVETAQTTRIEERPILHGALSPLDVLLTYEGDVKLKNFSIAHVLSKYPTERKEAFRKIETYLSPEVGDGKPPEKRSDLYPIGLMLYRMLTGDPFFPGGRDIDLKQRMDASRLMVPFQDNDAIPGALAELILKCLNPNPSGRHGGIKDLKQALDTFLLSGDFAPSTFNLAFFMHTAFRTEIETETKALQDEKKINYLEYVVEATPPPPPAPEKRGMDAVQTVVLQTAGTRPAGAPVAQKPPAAEPRPSTAGAPAQARPSPAFMDSIEEPKKKSPVLVIAIAALAVLLGGGGAIYFATRPKAPVADSEAAARLKEMEEKVKALEAERADREKEIEALKQQESQAKTDDERKKIEVQRKKLEDEAKQRQAEQDAIKKKQDETAGAQKPAEETPSKKSEPEPSKAVGDEGTPTKVAAGGQPAGGTQPPAASSSTPVDPTATTQIPTTVPPPSSSEPAGPQVKEGDLVSLDACDVRPAMQKQGAAVFPPMAKRMNATGTVTVTVLISENGDVIDAKIIKPSGSRYGFDEAALDAGRKYRFSPGIKAGKRVRVWFTLPQFSFK